MTPQTWSSSTLVSVGTNHTQADVCLALAMRRVEGASGWHADLCNAKLLCEAALAAQSNSEHSRHWFFRGHITIDGELMPSNLFDLVKEPWVVSRSCYISVSVFVSNLLASVAHGDNSCCEMGVV